jgi:tetratricopeptide (TPR) repeat protein
MIRPLTRLTFLLDHQLYGNDTAGYHVINLLLHFGCGILVYGIVHESLKCLTNNEPFAFRGSLDAVPFWTALLFLIHPLGTETVTYLSGRATGLMSFFCLSSLYLFSRASQLRQRSAPFLTTYLAAILCLALALLSKETAITLPVALLLWQELFTRRPTDSAPPLPSRVLLPFWTIGVLFVLVACFHPRYRYLLHVGLGLRPPWENMLTQANTIAYSLGLFFFPTRLNVDHDLGVYHSLLEWPTPLSLVILLGLLLAAVLVARKRPLISFGVLWFFLQLLPTNSVIPRYDLLSERNLYLPSVGVFLAGASLWITGTATLASSYNGYALLRPSVKLVTLKLARYLPLVACLVLACFTFNRNAVYKNEVAFWLDAVRKSPRKTRAHNNLGYAYYLRGDFDHAIEEFRIAVSLDPNDQDVLQNLRKAWMQ